MSLLEKTLNKTKIDNTPIPEIVESNNKDITFLNFNYLYFYFYNSYI